MTHPLDEFVKHFPIAENLVKQARTTVSQKRPLSDLREHVRNFVLSEEPAAIVNQGLQQFIDIPESDPPYVQQDHMVLCQDFCGVLVAIGRSEAMDDTHTYSVTSEALLAPLSDEGFSYKTYELPTTWNHEIFDSEIIAEPAKVRHCAKGESLLLSQNNLYDYASSNDIVLKIVGPDHLPLMWEFNRNTLKATRVFSSVSDATTLTYILRFLSKHGNERSAGAVSHLLSHPYYFVRWEAVKALGNLDVDTLCSALKKLKEDPHPHIRRAVDKMLVQIEMEN